MYGPMESVFGKRKSWSGFYKNTCNVTYMCYTSIGKTK